MKGLVILAASLLPSLLQAQTIEFSVFFDSDKSVPRKEQIQPLDSIMATLEAESIVGISLVGHADTTSNRTYNEALAQKRVKAIALHLNAIGIPDSLLNIAWKGDAIPVGDNRTEVGRALNRRVTLTFNLKLLVEDTTIRSRPHEPTDCTHRDTVICFPSTGVCIRTNECQLLCCLVSITRIDRDALLRSALKCNMPDGTALGIIEAFQLNPRWPCEAETALDPSWTIEIPLPVGLEPQHVSLEFFSYDGTWMPPQKRSARMKVKKAPTGYVIEITVQRLIPVHIVCGYKLATHPVRFHLPANIHPSAMVVYSEPTRSALVCRKIRNRLWECSLPCTDSYTLRVLGLHQGFGTYIDLGELDHRIQMFGRECPRTEEPGKRFFGLIPTPERRLYKRYSLAMEKLQLSPSKE